jgi:hypothetical protein
MSVSTVKAARESLYDVDPRAGATIEVFYADRALETWQMRRWLLLVRWRRFSPEGIGMDRSDPLLCLQLGYRELRGQRMSPQPATLART